MFSLVVKISYEKNRKSHTQGGASTLTSVRLTAHVLKSLLSNFTETTRRLTVANFCSKPKLKSETVRVNARAKLFTNPRDLTVVTCASLENAAVASEI